MQSEFQQTTTDPLWEQISPLLDESLHQLGDKDRQAVLLRFFENKSLAEVGRDLGTGEDTARKRVSRALEKLRGFFLKRGVATTTAIIASAIAANSVQAAPAVLAKSVTAVAITKGMAAGGSTLTLIKGALKLMAWTKAKTTAVVVTVALMATVTTTLIIAKHSSRGNRFRPAPAPEMAAPGAKVLIFRNVRSWNRLPDFEEALVALNVKFDVKSSARMGNADLSGYDVVIVPGAQGGDSYYRDYIRSAAVFDRYVSNGGTLVFELNGAEQARITLPGNVKMVAHGAVDN